MLEYSEEEDVISQKTEMCFIKMGLIDDIQGYKVPRTTSRLSAQENANSRGALSKRFSNDTPNSKQRKSGLGCLMGCEMLVIDLISTIAKDTYHQAGRGCS